MTKSDTSFFLTKSDVSFFFTKSDISFFLIKSDVSVFLTKSDISLFLTKFGISSFLIKAFKSTIFDTSSFLRRLSIWMQFNLFSTFLSFSFSKSMLSSIFFIETSNWSLSLLFSLLFENLSLIFDNSELICDFNSVDNEDFVSLDKDLTAFISSSKLFFTSLKLFFKSVACFSSWDTLLSVFNDFTCSIIWVSSSFFANISGLDTCFHSLKLFFRSFICFSSCGDLLSEFKDLTCSAILVRSSILANKSGFVPSLMLFSSVTSLFSKVETLVSSWLIFSAVLDVSFIFLWIASFSFKVFWIFSSIPDIFVLNSDSFDWSFSFSAVISDFNVSTLDPAFNLSISDCSKTSIFFISALLSHISDLEFSFCLTSEIPPHSSFNFCCLLDKSVSLLFISFLEASNIAILFSNCAIPAVTLLSKALEILSFLSVWFVSVWSEVSFLVTSLRELISCFCISISSFKISAFLFIFSIRLFKSDFAVETSSLLALLSHKFDLVDKTSYFLERSATSVEHLSSNLIFCSSWAMVSSFFLSALSTNLLSICNFISSCLLRVSSILDFNDLISFLKILSRFNKSFFNARFSWSVCPWLIFETSCLMPCSEFSMEEIFSETLLISPFTFFWIFSMLIFNLFSAFDVRLSVFSELFTIFSNFEDVSFWNWLIVSFIFNSFCFNEFILFSVFLNLFSICSFVTLTSDVTWESFSLHSTMSSTVPFSLDSKLEICFVRRDMFSSSLFCFWLVCSFPWSSSHFSRVYSISFLVFFNSSFVNASSFLNSS